MELKDPKITILVGRENTIIEVEEGFSGQTFLRVQLTPEQLSSALSRMSGTKCESAKVFGYDRLNKKHEHKFFEFELPEYLSSYEDRHSQALKDYAESIIPEGWRSDGYFRSQKSFFDKDGKDYARVVIRRWVEVKE